MSRASCSGLVFVCLGLGVSGLILGSSGFRVQGSGCTV